MRRKNGKGKARKSEYRIIMSFAFTCVFFIFSTAILFGKYYAGQSSKGVATASSLYFTSDVLRNLQGSDNYAISYNSKDWNGNGPCELEVSIRNYQNQLLYNDKNLNIMYNIKFELEGPSDGGSYTVSSGSITKDISGSAYEFTNVELAGGMARTNQFKVSITRPDSQSDNSNYKSVGVKVTAEIVTPDYAVNYGKLGGILYASMLSNQYMLNHNFEKVNQSMMSDYSGFPCTITYRPGEDNLAHRVKLKWDNKLQIDQFNEFFIAAKENDQYRVNGDSSYIIMTLQPYSTADVVFYRNSNFDDRIVNLSALIQIEDLDLDTN